MTLIRRKLELNRSRLGIVFVGLAIMCFALPGALSAQDAAGLYNKKCAVCHGKDGLGKTAKGKKVHVKSVAENISHSEADQIKIVEDGKGDDMDGYKKDFNADEIKGLVEYYRSLAGTAKK
jgi:cytochrome c6